MSFDEIIPYKEYNENKRTQFLYSFALNPSKQLTIFLGIFPKLCGTINSYVRS